MPGLTRIRSISTALYNVIVIVELLPKLGRGSEDQNSLRLSPKAPVTGVPKPSLLAAKLSMGIGFPIAGKKK
jgi:hypothetical protein